MCTRHTVDLLIIMTKSSLSMNPAVVDQETNAAVSDPLNPAATGSVAVVEAKEEVLAKTTNAKPSKSKSMSTSKKVAGAAGEAANGATGDDAANAANAAGAGDAGNGGQGAKAKAPKAPKKPAFVKTAPELISIIYPNLPESEMMNLALNLGSIVFEMRASFNKYNLFFDRLSPEIVLVRGYESAGLPRVKGTNYAKRREVKAVLRSSVKPSVPGMLMVSVSVNNMGLAKRDAVSQHRFEVTRLVLDAPKARASGDNAATGETNSPKKTLKALEDKAAKVWLIRKVVDSASDKSA